MEGFFEAVLHIFQGRGALVAGKLKLVWCFWDGSEGFHKALGVSACNFRLSVWRFQDWGAEILNLDSRLLEFRLLRVQGCFSLDVSCLYMQWP